MVQKSKCRASCFLKAFARFCCLVVIKDVVLAKAILSNSHGSASDNSFTLVRYQIPESFKSPFDIKSHVELILYKVAHEDHF